MSLSVVCYKMIQTLLHYIAHWLITWDKLPYIQSTKTVILEKWSTSMRFLKVSHGKSIWRTLSSILVSSGRYILKSTHVMIISSDICKGKCKNHLLSCPCIIYVALVNVASAVSVRLWSYYFLDLTKSSPEVLNGTFHDSHNVYWMMYGLSWIRIFVTSEAIRQRFSRVTSENHCRITSRVPKVVFSHIPYMLLCITHYFIPWTQKSS